VGVGAAELTWWLSDLCFGKGSNVAVGASGNTVDVVYNFQLSFFEERNKEGISNIPRPLQP
jgi:hypothetical protein